MADASPEGRRQKALVTAARAKGLVDAERASVRENNDRLKALRLAKAAKDGVTELNKKPPVKKGQRKR